MTATGPVTLAQLSMLLEGIDWRRPGRTFRRRWWIENGGFASLSFVRVDAICYKASVSEAARLRTLEDENRLLKKLLAEPMLDVSALKDLLGKN